MFHPHPAENAPNYAGARKDAVLALKKAYEKAYEETDFSKNTAQFQWLSLIQSGRPHGGVRGEASR
jgi:hypothetical protein